MAEPGQAGATLPDAHGYFGRYGGRFVAETLMQPLRELAAAYRQAKAGSACAWR